MIYDGLEEEKSKSMSNLPVVPCSHCITSTTTAADEAEEAIQHLTEVPYESLITNMCHYVYL